MAASEVEREEVVTAPGVTAVERARDASLKSKSHEQFETAVSGICALQPPRYHTSRARCQLADAKRRVRVCSD